MLKSYLIVALRNFSREKSYALINILGLALAIACGIVLSVYVRSEMTYDQHNVNHERIYRMVDKYTTNGKTDEFAASPQAMGPLLKREYPDLVEFVRFRPIGRAVLRVDDIEAYWDDVRMADPNVFDVFTHKAVYGDLSKALVDPSSIAISQSFAEHYFGNRNPIGELIGSDNFDFRVTAVYEDLPDNSHLKYSALMSMKRLHSFGQNDDNATVQQLFNIGIYTYFMVAEGRTQQDLQSALDSFYESKVADVGKQFQLEAEFLVQPLSEVHFDTGWDYDEPTGNIFYVYGFIAVAAFVVLIACINYTNLATARATKRAKEVGMRKIIGAERSQLMLQFMGESIVYAVVALIVGLMLVFLAEAYTPLNLLLGKTDLLNFAEGPEMFAFIAAGMLLVALMAGAYPALYLSSITPLSALTTTKRGRRPGFALREALVFVQFLVSVGVLSATILMGIQMSYVANKPLGFDAENKLAITLRGVDAVEKIPVVRNEILKNANVLGFAETSYIPGQPVTINLMQIENNDGQMESTSLNHIAVGKEFVEVMGIEIIEGRDFSKKLLTDVGTSVVVNETLVRTMGWENPIGKRIQLMNARVVGVMKDFHFTSLHQPVAPMFIRPFPPTDFSNVPPLQRNLVTRTIVVSVVGDGVFRTINDIDSVISQFDPKHPFEYRFFDDLLGEMYEDENNLMKLTAVLAGICIFVSCMGLYGLAAFTTEQRTKEIGIRKVLGSSTTEIILLLTQKLLALVLVAAILGSIASYATMDDWLSVFAYRTEIELWVFAFASLAVALIALVTVAAQSFVTANTNPVEALRYE